MNVVSGVTAARERDNLTILHLTDVHFGYADPRHEQARVTESLVAAVHDQDVEPDLVVFSGDLAHSGKPEEFETGQRWLEKILSPWPQTRLFIVPGNHDVDRNAAKLGLRQIEQDEESYHGARENLGTQLAHLDNFFAWHARLKLQLGDRLVSEWSSPFGSKTTVPVRKRNIQLIGLNTALLSCDTNDQGRLIQDVAALNKALGDTSPAEEGILAVGHHPLGWLAPWNSTLISNLLHQSAGAHVYMHGHRHSQTALVSSNNLGAGLTVLEGGAAYQDTRWSQYFSFYTLDFLQGSIKPDVYAFITTSGKWIKDNARSEEMACLLPRKGPPQAHLEAPATGSAPSPEDTPAEPVADQARGDEVDLALFRILAAANALHPMIRLRVNASVAHAVQIYRHSDRVKETPNILEKVRRRRGSGKTDYSLYDVEDVCGFRYVT